MTFILAEYSNLPHVITIENWVDIGKEALERRIKRGFIQRGKEQMSQVVLSVEFM